MEILVFIAGLALPALGGWLLLDLLQGRRRVLTRAEQGAAGLALGLHAHMFLVFCAHAYLGIPLSLAGLLGVQLAAVVPLGIARFMLGAPAGAATVAPSPRMSRALAVALGVLLAWVTVKAVIAGVTFLVLTPTYLDDSLDNWNLRGKVYFYDQALTLTLPGEDPATAAQSVSSYPPSVPLMKTWLAALNGGWSEPLTNALHIVWYACALVLVYGAVRRRASRAWALSGAYLLGAMPLYLMHGTNPYGDAFVSVHVFLAVGMLFSALREDDSVARAAFVRIGAVSAALLPFTKNEGLLIYLPPALVILAAGLWLRRRSGGADAREMLRALAWYGAATAVCTLPWLVFKWMNGLTFANAKPVDALGFGWQEGVVDAIVVNTLMEGNWLLLFPLLALLLVWRRRAAFGELLPLTAFFFIVFGGQIVLFLFTGLSAEARLQTGLARGVIQQLPVIILLATLLLATAGEQLQEGAKALAGSFKKAVR